MLSIYGTRIGKWEVGTRLSPPRAGAIVIQHHDSNLADGTQPHVFSLLDTFAMHMLIR